MFQVKPKQMPELQCLITKLIQPGFLQPRTLSCMCVLQLRFCSDWSNRTRRPKKLCCSQLKCFCFNLHGADFLIRHCVVRDQGWLGSRVHMVREMCLFHLHLMPEQKRSVNGTVPKLSSAEVCVCRCVCVCAGLFTRGQRPQLETIRLCEKSRCARGWVPSGVGDV